MIINRPDDVFAISSLQRLLAQLESRTVILVTGAASFESSGAAEQVSRQTENVGVHHIRVSGDLNRWSDACAISSGIAWRSSDVILAVGGGKVLDFAKTLNYIGATGDTEIAAATGENKWPCKALPTIAIPLTAGSGSEATQFAAVFHEGLKHSIDHPDLKPAWVILEPSFLVSCPARFQAAALFDALCQAIESGWALGSTRTSRDYSQQALEILSRSVREDPQCLDIKMLHTRAVGAHFAGKAINIAHTTAPHALSYAPTHDFGIPHGEMVARLLPHFFEQAESAPATSIRHPLGQKFIERWTSSVRGLLSCPASESFTDCWYQLMHFHGLDVDGPVTEAPESSAILSRANPERLTNHPIELLENQLVSILNTVLNPPDALNTSRKDTFVDQ